MFYLHSYCIWRCISECFNSIVIVSGGVLVICFNSIVIVSGGVLVNVLTP